MTPTTLPDEILKTDALGRVRTPKARREALLEEFARSGVRGQKFAALVGVNYQTFASWVQQRRKQRGESRFGSEEWRRVTLGRGGAGGGRRWDGDRA